MSHRRRTNDTTSGRNGTVTVELAVCLPTLVFTFLAAVQAADMIFLKQTLQVAGYEAARAAIKRTATNDQARTSGEQILVNRNVESFTIAFLPPDVSNAARGEVISVTVEAPAYANTVLPGYLCSFQNMAVTTKMVKE